MHNLRYFPQTPFLKILLGFVPGLWLAWVLAQSMPAYTLGCTPGCWVIWLFFLTFLFLCCWRLRRGWFIFYFFSAFVLMGFRQAQQMRIEVPGGRVRFVFRPDERLRVYEEWGTVTGNAWVKTGKEGALHFRCALNIRNPLAVEEAFRDGRPLVCEGEFKVFETNRIPGMFDRKGFYFVRGIRHQVWLQPSDLIGFAEGKGWGWALRLRYLASGAIATGGLPAKAAGFADAFFTGQKSALDKEVQRDFSLTGISHILAVSGQHVGLIYLLLTEVLMVWMTGRRLQRWRSIVVVAFIWAYIAMTGMSASAVRAGYMFTLFSAAVYIPFRVNNLNILCFSGFSMLLANPFLLFDVGFQLSYAAMGGIIIVFPLLKVKSARLPGIVVKMLDMIMITLAAQVFTFPLIVYYFKMFPLLFVLSNLLTGFLLPVIMALIFVYLLCSPLTVIQWYIAQVLGWLINYILGVASYLADIPFGVLHFVHISEIEAAMLFLSGVFFTVFLVQKKAWMLQGTMGTICLLLLFSSVKVWRLKQKEYLALFHWKGNSYLAWTSGNHGYVCWIGGKKPEGWEGMPPVEAYLGSKQRVLTAWFDQPGHITAVTGALVEEAGTDNCLLHLPYTTVLMIGRKPDSAIVKMACHPAIDMVTGNLPADLPANPSSVLWINTGNRSDNRKDINLVNLREVGWLEMAFRR